MMKYRRIRRRSSKMSEDDRRREDGSSSSSSSPHSDPTALATMTYSVARDKTGSGAGSSRSSPPLPAPPLLPSAALALTLLLTLVLSPATAVAAAASSGGGNPPMVQRTTTSARGRSGAFVHRWRCSPPPPSSSLPRGQLIGGTVSNPAGSCPHRRGVPAGRRRLGPPPVVLGVVSSPTSSRRDIDADDDGGGGGGEGARRRQLRRGKRGGGGRGRNDEAEAPPPPPPFRVLSSVVVRDVPIPVLAHYLRDAFRLPTDLPMPYERAASSSATGTITNGEGGETSAAGIASWICTIYPDDTLLAAEIVAIRTDGEGDDDDDDGGGEDAQGDGVSPPRMAMVAVKSYRPADGGGMGGSRSLVDAAEGDVVRALERGLDELQNRPELQRRLRDEVCRGADVGGGSSPASNGVAGGEIADGRGNGSPSAIGWGIDGSDGGGGREGRKVPASMRHAGVDDRNGAASAGSSSTAVRPDVIVDVESVTADDADPPSSPAQRRADASSGASSGTYSTTTERNVNLDVGGDRDGKLTRPEAGEGEEGRELTSEELLREVLRFGDEEAERDRAGAGFARGAFDEAKELLRRRRQTQSEVPPGGPAATRLEYGYADDDGADSSKTSTPPPDFLSRRSVDDAAGGDTDDPREELRRIFEAGRELAEGRITSSVVGAAGATSPLSRDNSDDDDDDDVDVDALIASDRTVPAGARSIEDELAELEVRIGRDPGDDDRDGRPVFDLFSGPTPGGDETVDPATAVNWPGAAAGTREVRLHPELQEAVDNAKFAAKMLAELREEEGEGGATRYYVGRREVPVLKVDKLRKCVGEAVDVGIIDDPLEEMEERARLAMLLDELADQPEDRYEDITSGYKELLLSDRFVSLVRDRLDAMAGRDSRKTSGVDDSASDVAPTEGLSKDEKERSNLGKLTKSAMLLLKEAQQLGAELEAMQLETIRSICQVAMDPSHRTEEEAAIALSDAVRDMRPLLDDNLVAYLKYAISEEEGRLARRGLLDDPDHNSWLFVLKIVQQGVYAELGRALQRHTDSLWFVLRMESKSERRLLLEKLVDDLPSLDVRPFRKVVDNIVSSLGAGVRGDFDTDVIGGMTKKLLQLASDIKEVLPPEKIKRKSKDADEWAAQQRERIREMQQEKRQRLVAGREERAADGAMISGRGEIERI